MYIMLIGQIYPHPMIRDYTILKNNATFFNNLERVIRDSRQA